MKAELFPPLPLKEWEFTKKTLHLFIQIVGKVRMELMPGQNHWWHVPLYVNTKGLTTGSIPLKVQRIEITFDFINHELSVTSNKGISKSFLLGSGLSVAYSHEVISFGFWPGDENIHNPAFYSYTYPAPDGIDQEPLQPQSAHWVEQNGSPMALLMYKNVHKAENPDHAILDFLESAYQAGAKTAGWNTEDFKQEL